MWRYYYNKKYTTDDYSKTLSTKFLKKHWYLDLKQSGRWGTITWSRNWVEISSMGLYVNIYDTTGEARVYFTQTDRNTGEKKEFDYKIPLVATTCHYWWQRWWFLCPLRWNRCSILYLQNNWLFGSRKTLNLAYPSQNESYSKVFRSEIYALKAMMLREKIKYKYRNGKMTKKMKRLVRYALRWPSALWYTVEDLVNDRFGW
jgi:hypothetical protein